MCLQHYIGRDFLNMPYYNDNKVKNYNDNKINVHCNYLFSSPCFTIL